MRWWTRSARAASTWTGSDEPKSAAASSASGSRAQPGRGSAWPERREGASPSGIGSDAWQALVFGLLQPPGFGIWLRYDRAGRALARSERALVRAGRALACAGGSLFHASKVAGFGYLWVRHDVRRPQFVVLTTVFTFAAVCGIVLVQFSDKNEFIKVS